jgi:hypothetical protein
MAFARPSAVSTSSRDKASGDFGSGWNVSLRNIRVETSGTLGKIWRRQLQPGFWPEYCLTQAEHPDERELEAPQRARSIHPDSPRLAPALLFQLDNQLPPPKEDLAHGFGAGVPGQHSVCQPTKASRAQEGMLDM